MKEADIRPDEYAEKERQLKMEDIRSILSNKDKFSFIPCPACNSKKNSVFFEKDGFNFVECDECKTIFVNPRPSFKILYDYYASSKSIQFWNEYVFPASEESRRKYIFKPRAKRVIELCKKFNTKPELLLDVGAGFGTFCEEIIKLNYFNSVIAVEPSHDLAETCYKKGIKVVELPIEDVKIENVDVITNFELIEHLYWPENFIRSCNKILGKNGLLIMTTPNIKGFDLLILGKESENVVAPFHINYFHPKSIKILLERCGFEIVEILTPGNLDIELVRKKVLDKKLDISVRPFLKHIIIDEWEDLRESFQKYLADNCLSSNMWVVAKIKQKEII